MTEKYNMYNSPYVDLDKDSAYDFVLEREQLKELDNTGQKCINDVLKEKKEKKEENFYEYFTNKCKNNTVAENGMILLILLLALYVIFYLIYNNKPKLNGNYTVRLS